MMKVKLKGMAAVCTALLSSALAQETILESDFTGTSPAQNQPWTNVAVQSSSLAFSGWTTGDQCITATNNDAFVFAVNGGYTHSTLSEAIEAEAYLSCTITPTGDALNLNEVQMNMRFDRMNEMHSPRCFAVFTSATGFEAGDEIYTSDAVEVHDYDPLELSFFFPDSGFESVTEPLEIRIVCFLAIYDWKYFAFEEFSLVSGIDTCTLSLSAETGGSIVASDSKTVFAAGSTTEVTATPDDGYRFAGWSGDMTGLGNPRTITMDSDKSITALFEALPATNRMEVGTNLDSVNDWSTSFVFKDLFWRFRSWLTINSEGTDGFDSGYISEAPMDENEWPTQVPFYPSDGSTQLVHTILCDANDAGEYTFSYEGTGTFRMWGDGVWKQIDATGGTNSFSFTSERYGMIQLKIYESDSSDPLRNFSLVANDDLDDYLSQPFHPTFVEKSAGFSVLRFMDWQETNGSGLSEWSDRTRTNHCMQTRSEGVALEWMIALSNLQQSDPWICIPHQATDEYVTETATLLRDSLDAGLKVYVEYSNEIWNSGFTQYSYANEQGVALGLSTNSWTAGRYYTSLRSMEIWKLFEDVFGDEMESRVVKVLGSQAYSTGVTTTMTDAFGDPDINTNEIYPDALAIAPYFYEAYTSDDEPYPTSEEIATSISIECISNAQICVEAQKALADQQGLDLICYEGGQHFIGLYSAVSDTNLTSILTTANGLPAMYERYVEYLDMLQEEGVSLFVNFTLDGTWSKYGSWGLLQYIDESEEQAFKYMAVRDWMAENLDDENLLEITDLSVDESQIIWRSKPTHSYEILSSTNLQNWTSVSNSVYTESIYTTNSLSLGAEDSLFFRVMEEE